MAEDFQRMTEGSSEDYFDREIKTFKIIDGVNLVYPSPSEMVRGLINTSMIRTVFYSRTAIGGFSEDGQKHYYHDKSKLLFFDTKFYPEENSSTKEVSLDLTIAQDEAVSYSGTPRQALNNLLMWMMDNHEIVQREFPLLSKPEKSRPAECKSLLEFIVVRNLLSRILKAAYNCSNTLIFYAQYVNHTIYLMGHKEEKQKSSREAKYSNWTRKFKQYMTGQNVNEAAVANVSYNGVMKALIGPFNVLYSVSTDCTDPDLYREEALDLTSFINLKCVQEHRDDFLKEATQKHKMMFWYFDCLFSSIEKIIIGFRDGRGKVSSLELFTDDEILKIAEKYYNPNVGLTFLSEVLEYVSKVARKFPDKVLKFTRKRREQLITCEVQDNIPPLVPSWFNLGGSKEDRDEDAAAAAAAWKERKRVRRPAGRTPAL